MSKHILDLPEEFPKNTLGKRLRNYFSQERLAYIAIFFGIAVSIMATLEDSSLIIGILIIEFLLFPMGYFFIAAILCGLLYFFIEDYRKAVLVLATLMHIILNLILLLGISLDYWAW